MAEFIRVKNFIINIESVAYVQVEENEISFGLSFHSKAQSSPNNVIPFKRGDSLQDGEFEQLKEFVLGLPKPDWVIAL